MQSSEKDQIFQCLHVQTSRKLNFPADQVWDLTAGFDTLSLYHDASVGSRLSKGGGAIRYLTIAEEAGSGVVVDRLIRFNRDAKTFSYRIINQIDCSMPFRNDQAWVRLKLIDKHGCKVYWESRFNFEEASEEEVGKFSYDIYQGCYDGIEKALSN